MSRAYEQLKDPPCHSAKDLLKQVSSELAKFEAKKLDELEKALDAFVKKQDTLVKDYSNKFPALRNLWCERQKEAQDLCSRLRCEFPTKETKWKELIEKSICTPMHDLCCLENRIATRKSRCSGLNERKRDQAKAAFDAAKSKLDCLMGLAAKLQSALDANKKLAAEINGLTGDDRPVALFLFWFRFLPIHKHMAPHDALQECKDLCLDHDPDTLCCSVNQAGCKKLDGKCTCDGETACDPCANFPAQDGPWLMNPDDYLKALDCSWSEYFAAKEALAQAEADLKQEADDLPSLVAEFEADKKSLEEKIKKSLRIPVATEDCCK